MSDEIAIFFGLACAATLSVAPLVSIALSVGMRSRLRRLEQQLVETEASVARLDGQLTRANYNVKHLHEEVVGLRAAQARGVVVTTSAPPAAASTPVGAPETPVQAVPASPAPEAEAPVGAETPAPTEANTPAGEATPEPAVEPPVPDGSAAAPPPAEPPPKRPPAPEPIKPSKPLSVELLGTWLFAAMGGLLVLVGGLLFFNYALDQGWFGRFGPGARFTLGIAAGLGAVIAGQVLQRRQYAIPAAAFGGGGLGILYGAIYAGRTLYDLLDQPIAFAAMVAVTIASGLISWRWRSQFLSMLGLIGGLLTPVLLSTGENKAMALFSYLALLNVGAIWVSSARGWPITAGLAAVGTLAMQLGWAERFGAMDQVPIGLAAAAVFAAIYGASAMRKESSGAVGWTMGMGTMGQGLAAIPMLLPYDSVSWEPIGNDTYGNYGQVFHDPGMAPWMSAGWIVLFSVWLLVMATRKRSMGMGIGAAAVVVLDQLVLGGSWGEAMGGVVDSEHALYGMLALGILAPAWTTLGATRADTEGENPVARWLPLLMQLGGGFAAMMAVGMAEAPPPLVIGAVLLMGLAGAAGRGNNPWSPVTGLLAAAMPMYAAMPTMMDNETLSVTALAPLAVVLILNVLPLLRKEQVELGPWLAAALAGPIFYLPMHMAWDEAWGSDLIGMLPLSLGALSMVGAVYVRRILRSTAEDRTLAMLVTVATLFACVAVPVQLSRHWLVMGWALESAVLAWLGLRLRHPSVRWFAVAMAMGAVGRLAMTPYVVATPVHDHTVIFNLPALTYAVTAASLLVAARGLAQGPPLFGGIPVPTLMRVAATLVLFVGLNVELSLAFAEDGIPRFGGTFRQEMLRSIIWAVYGGVLLALGVWRDNGGTRLLAMGFLLLAAAKVFLSDLWALEGMFRVASVFGAAMTLLGSAVLLQRVVLRQRREDSEK